METLTGNFHSGIAPARSARCPYAQLDDLMTVVEALCPVWPSRPVMRDQSRFRL
jgi:hypothetical protein